MSTSCLKTDFFSAATLILRTTTRQAAIFAQATSSTADLREQSIHMASGRYVVKGIVESESQTRKKGNLKSKQCFLPR